MTQGAIRLTDITAVYERHPAVHHVSGEFAPGSMTAIVGPNGAGKTTLLKVLMGLHQPSHGRIDRGGLQRAQVALLAQAQTMERDFPISCLDVAMSGAVARIGVLRGLGGVVRHDARHALAAVGLAGFDARLVGTLSAGQFQRLLFARLMMQDAPVILLDEPFNAVDEKTMADLLKIVHRWHDEGRTVIAVLHDLDLVRRHFPQTLLLARGCIGWGKTADILTPGNCRDAQMMAEAWRANAEICHEHAA